MIPDPFFGPANAWSRSGASPHQKRSRKDDDEDEDENDCQGPRDDPLLLS
jgi:hypothetical protein